VIAVEVLCACQALDLLSPLTTSTPLSRVHAEVRKHVPTLVDDRPPAPDLDRIVQLIRSGTFEYSSAANVN
jgi:histidine ammonia-lyase